MSIRAGIFATGLLLALPCVASAQSFPPWSSQIVNQTQHQITADDLRSALGNKADVTGGSLTNPTLTAPTITGGMQSGANVGSDLVNGSSLSSVASTVSSNAMAIVSMQQTITQLQTQIATLQASGGSGSSTPVSYPTTDPLVAGQPWNNGGLIVASTGSP